MSSDMVLRYSEINSAWISYFGDAPCSILGENFFPDISAARRTLHRAGLRLARVNQHYYRIIAQ